VSFLPGIPAGKFPFSGILLQKAESCAILMVQAACGIVSQAENNMQKGGSVVNYQNATPEIQRKRVPRKAAVVALSVLSAALAVSCCLMGYHLQCTQKSLSVSQRQVIEAASYLRYADSVVDDYADRIETYIQYPAYARYAERYNFSRTFESYQHDHKVPEPNPYPWNKAIPIEK
jgi:hypothetical protein